jgi:hypothetical protein
MPTRSGLEYLLPRTIYYNMSVSDNDAYNFGPRTVYVVYAVGQTQYTKLILDDIYYVDKQIMVDEAYELIVRPMSMLTKQMVNGYHSSKFDSLEEAIKRQDADIYLHESDGASPWDAHKANYKPRSDSSPSRPYPMTPCKS